jgi:hypothetical protein
MHPLDIGTCFAEHELPTRRQKIYQGPLSSTYYTVVGREGAAFRVEPVTLTAPRYADREPDLVNLLLSPGLTGTCDPVATVSLSENAVCSTPAEYAAVRGLVVGGFLPLVQDAFLKEEEGGFARLYDKVALTLHEVAGAPLPQNSLAEFDALAEWADPIAKTFLNPRRLLGLLDTVDKEAAYRACAAGYLVPLPLMIYMKAFGDSDAGIFR